MWLLLSYGASISSNVGIVGVDDELVAVGDVEKKTDEDRHKVELCCAARFAAFEKNLENSMVF